MLRRVRMAAITVGAVASALVNVATGRGERRRVMLRPGDRAPDFSLPGSDGVRYRLAEMTGRHPVVLAWFPKAYTGGCAAECKSLVLSGAALRASDARYFAVSTDRPETNRRFAEVMGLDYPVLSDPDRRAARAYGVVGASGFPSRWTFFIDRRGRIAAIDKHVHTASHGADAAARLNALHL